MVMFPLCLHLCDKKLFFFMVKNGESSGDGDVVNT